MPWPIAAKHHPQQPQTALCHESTDGKFVLAVLTSVDNTVEDLRHSVSQNSDQQISEKLIWLKNYR